jgi:hypothetical protein
MAGAIGERDALRGAAADSFARRGAGRGAGKEWAMADDNRRSMGEGITAGIIAGVIFAAVEIVGAAMMGDPPLMPVRMFASVALGQRALEGSLGVALVVGTIAHLVLSALFGIVYGLLNTRVSGESKTSFGRQAGLGILFGLAVWLVNFQVIARVLYPWFLGAPQFLQAMMHALFFGLPLALIYAASERKAHAHVAATRTV